VVSYFHAPSFECISHQPVHTVRKAKTVRYLSSFRLPVNWPLLSTVHPARGRSACSWNGFTKYVQSWPDVSEIGPRPPPPPTPSHFLLASCPAYSKCVAAHSRADIQLSLYELRVLIPTCLFSHVKYYMVFIPCQVGLAALPLVDMSQARSSKWHAGSTSVLAFLHLPR
jgi:hypothetical protein